MQVVALQEALYTIACIAVDGDVGGFPFGVIGFEVGNLLADVSGEVVI